MNSHWINENVGVIDTVGLGYEGAIASYVVRGSRGAALVDVGHAATARNVVDGVRALGVDPRSIEYLFITHHHMDHMGAVPHILKELPEARVVVQEDSIRFLVEPSRLVQATYEVFGDEYVPRIGSMPPTPPERIEPLREDGSYDLGGLTIRPLYTPGHTPSHTSFYLEELSAVFTGDTVCLSRAGLPILLPAASPPMIEVKSAVASLDKIRSLRPKLLLMPHFGHVDYSDEFLERNKETIIHFNDRVSELFSRGMKSEEIASELRKELLQELSGLNIDEFTRKVMLGKFLDVTVMGYVGALLRRRK
jgi:glyoxylase-like metal-dependent hydrolase (beta-lactamase superfamily II)